MAKTKNAKKNQTIEDMKEAQTGQCNDMHCPFHGGNIPHGRIFVGRVIKSLMHKTACVQWEYPFLIRKYGRYLYKKSRIKVHNPPCINASTRDEVVVMECRPISKTKHFVIIEKVRKGIKTKY